MQNDLHFAVSGTDLARRASRKKESAPKAAVLLMIVIWLMLIAGGAAGAAWYAGRIQDRMTADIERQTAERIAAMQQEVEARMAELEAAFRADILDVQAKVDELNELLTFARDNAADDKDDSNQLYSQLSEVKEKLEQLQKQLDVLK